MYSGLSIAGGKGAAANRIFVVDVKPGGPAEKDGKIQQADEILEVNDIGIRGLTHYEASTILKVSFNIDLMFYLMMFSFCFDLSRCLLDWTVSFDCEFPASITVVFRRFEREVDLLWFLSERYYSLLNLC